MPVKIKKLTPPQIEALRTALPACVKAGVLETTNSIATFDARRTVRWPAQPERRLGVADVYRMVELASRRFPHAPLLPVLRKLEDRPDLVEEVA